MICKSLLPLLLVLGSLLSASAQRVYRERLEPQWLGDNSRFWYRNELSDGAREFVLVDAVKGERKPAFDHARVAAALSRLTGQAVAAGKLPIEALEFATNQATVTLRGRGQSWLLQLASHEVTAVAGAGADSAKLPFDREVRPSRRTGPESEITFVNTFDFDVELFWLDPEGNRQSYGLLKHGQEKAQHTFAGHVWLAARPGGSTLAVFEATDAPARAVIEDREPTRPPGRRRDPAPAAASTAVKSPNGQWDAFVRDHNLWVRSTSVRTNEFALSFDGNPGHHFRRDASRDRLVGMDYEKADYPEPLPEVHWSPDSKKLVALQTRVVPERRVYLVESAPKDQFQPKLQSYPYLKPGDEIPGQTPRLFDVTARREVGVDRALFPNPWDLGSFRWAADSGRFTFVYNQRGHQVLRVLAVDAASGAVHALVEERSDTFIHYSGKFLCDWLGEDELLWMSERDGWNHLWLYDAKNGAVKQQVTRGEWNVRDVVRVDREQREVWFRAVGLPARSGSLSCPLRPRETRRQRADAAHRGRRHPCGPVVPRQPLLRGHVVTRGLSAGARAAPGRRRCESMRPRRGRCLRGAGRPRTLPGAVHRQGPRWRDRHLGAHPPAEGF